MHRLTVFRIALFVVIQHILAVFGQRPRTTNPCPNDFLRIHNRCYYFSSQDDTWQGAKMRCDDKNSTLAIINSISQNNALKVFLKKGYTDAKLPNSSRLQISAPRWLGSQYDWNAAQWKWVYNGKLIPSHLLDKERFHKKELAWHCLTIDPTNNFSWNCDSCFAKNYYICQTKLSHRLNAANLIDNSKTKIKNESPPSNIRNNSTELHVSDSQPGFYVVTAENSVPSKGNERKKKQKKQKLICLKNFILVRKKCYYFSRDKTTWNDAFYKCQDLKSDLAVFKNLQQDKKLRIKVNKFRLSNEASWIGGQYDYQNSIWKWAANGHVLPVQLHPLQHSQWACVLWDPNVTDRWTSDSCFKVMPYICQKSARLANKKHVARKPSNPRHQY